jgi:hypothetical protein
MFLFNTFRHVAPSRQAIDLSDQARYQTYFSPRDTASCPRLPPDFLIQDFTTTRSSRAQLVLYSAHLLHRLAIVEIETEESEIPGVFAAVPEDYLSLLPIPDDNQWRRRQSS